MAKRDANARNLPSCIPDPTPFILVRVGAFKDNILESGAPEIVASGSSVIFSFHSFSLFHTDT